MQDGSPAQTGQTPQDAAASTDGLIALGLLALVVGLGTGLICALFRLGLIRGAALRDDLANYARFAELPGQVPGYVLTGLAAAAAAALAAGLVRRVAPAAKGSGIPHAEAVLRGKLPPARARVIPVKFVGGLAAIAGGGLALGREGPSVQMGSTVGHMVGGWMRRGWQDRRALIAGGAGAGLATAFNAPAAGAIFVIEELVGRFESRTIVVALGASVGAIAVSRALLGDAPNFDVADLASGGLQAQPLFLLLGLFIGLLSVLYSRCLLATLRLAEWIGGPVELRAAAIGAATGVLLWFAPDLVGGGDNITQAALNGGLALVVLPGIFVLRLVLATGSYAAATPGGLFSPMLVLGAVAGLGFGIISAALLPALEVPPATFAVVGMGALFVGVVRAPMTGIVLVSEMTGSAGLLLPLLSGCFGAMLVTEMLGQPPIYESLGRLEERAAAGGGARS